MTDKTELADRIENGMFLTIAEETKGHGILRSVIEDDDRALIVAALRTPPSALEAKGAADAVREALKPFANLANGYDDEIDSDDRPVGPVELKLCRAARAALRSLPAVTGGPAEYLRDEVRADGSISTELCDKTDPGAYPVYRALPAPKAAGDIDAVSGTADDQGLFGMEPSSDARAAVIEECAKIADDIAEGAATPNGQSRARAIATRIRALSKAPAADGAGS